MADDVIRIRFNADPGNVESTVERTTQALGRIGTAGEVSAKQAAAAMRGLPAQFTDIATSLQGGQNPLTVLLQQGGQIKDMFGGVGPAVRAVGSQVAAMVTPVTALAAAGTIFAIAYAKGADEAANFNRQLILTGNAAGTTAGRLQDASKRVAALVGTQSQAAAALAELAGAANISPAGLERFAAAALKMQRATGVSVADTVKQFVELGRAPVEASAKLNESNNYLTLGVYRQIKALQDAGRTADAARVAQDAWADALSGRSDQIVQKLGLLERGWQAVKDGAGSAWNAMLNVGRADTLGDQLATAEKRLRDLQRERDVNLRSNTGRRSGTFAAQLADQQAIIDSLREQIRLEGSVADRAREAADKVRARGEFDKLVEGSLTQQERLSRAIVEANNLANSAGASAAERAKVIAALREKFKGAEGNPFAAEQEAAKRWADSLMSFDRIADSASGKAAELTKGQIDLLAVLKSPDWSIWSEEMGQIQLAHAFAAINAEKQGAATEHLARVLKEAKKTYDEQISAMERGVATIEAQIQGQRDEAAASELAEVRHISLSRAIQEVEIARLRERQAALAGLDSQQATSDIIDREIDARRRLADAMDTTAARKAAEKLRQDQVQEWQRVWDQVGEGLADALINGGSRAADTIKRMFSQMVLRPVIQATLGGFAAALGLTGPASASGGPSGAGVLAGGSSPFASLGTLFGAGGAVGSLGSIFNAGSALALNGGTLVSLQGAGAMIGNGSMLGGLAQGAGTVAPWLAGIGLGRTVGQGISGGFAVGGGSGNAAVNIGTAIGAIWGPIGAAVGGALGGVVNRAFGRRAPETRDSGVFGTLGGDQGTSLQSFQDWFQKGGFFRSNRSGTNISALDTQTAGTFNTAVAAIQQATRGYAATLGLSADSVSGYTQQIRLSLQGLNEQQVTEAIQTTLARFADGLASGLGADLAALAKPGEAVGTTLARLATSLQQANGVLDNLNQGLLATSTAGADAAAKLLEAFGSLDSYVALSASYLDAFYDAGERSAIVTRQLTASFANLGLALPTTRDSYRALVDAQDLTTDGGRRTYAALLQLSGAFASVTDAVKLNVSSVTSEIERLRGAGAKASTGPANLAGLLSQFAATTGQARAGSQSAIDALPDISRSIEAASQSTARTAAEVAVMRAYLARSLADTLSATGSVDVSAQAVSASTTGTAAAPGAAQDRSMVQEMQALRAALEALRTDQQAQAAQLATNTGKLYRLMDRASQGGDAISVRVLPS